MEKLMNDIKPLVERELGPLAGIGTLAAEAAE
jgi:hypothetical protein